ncbi:MAG: hypothetical protein KBS91_00650 [Firmicutes bacterium]|nr:hypothetical protein [Candidatus Caballimonas caccae]
MSEVVGDFLHNGKEVVLKKINAGDKNIIFRVGRIVPPSSGGVATYNFTSAFPNHCYGVIGGAINANLYNENSINSMKVRSFNRTSFNAIFSYNSGYITGQEEYFYYLAIGD